MRKSSQPQNVLRGNMLQTDSGKNKKRFGKFRVPFISLPISIVATLALSYVLFTNTAFRTRPNTSTKPIETSSAMQQLRLKNFSFVRPLLIVDVNKESEKLQTLKVSIDQYVADKQQTGDLTSASVYIRKLNNGEWINTNPNESYQPASLLKLPLLLTMFKLSESNPSLLSKMVVNNIPPENIPAQSFSSSTLVPGKSYSVLDLMYAMVTNSDNTATSLLHTVITPEQFDRVYVDLGFPPPPHQDWNYSMTAADYSKFMRVLFNATYLNQKNSDFSLMMLSKSSFLQGLHKGVPGNVVVANKFGESSGKGFHMLHDVGIVYANNEPYLIVVMTKGSDVNKLSTVISDISKMTYDYWITNVS